MINRLKKITKIIREVKNLPVKKITLGADEAGKKLYANFNSRHPRFFLIRKKTIGVALVDKRDFDSPEAYLKSVNGKNSAAYFSRKAAAAGCTFEQIDANFYADEIHAIHMSAESRQGRKLDASYYSKITAYPSNDNNQYFGIKKEGQLVAYVWIVKSGDLMMMSRIMGHSDFLDFGVMYLLVTSFIQFSFQLSPKIVMYDTLLGGGDGLKLFKKRCGFQPYRVKWNIAS